MITIDHKSLDLIFSSVHKLGYQLIGPKIKNGAIVYDTVKGIHDLPEGWTEDQDGGTYRLQKRKDNALFGFNSTPESWKKFLHPPLTKLWNSKRNGNKITIDSGSIPKPKLAFIGVRACDLNAIIVLDKVLADLPYSDSIYKSQRTKIFIIAVNCGQAAKTCFCASMKTGPRAVSRFDLALTEVIDGNRHYFLVETGSKNGEGILKNIPHREATAAEIDNADALTRQTAACMKRQVDTTDLKQLLYRNSENARWHQTAKRCLSCGNCTQVCPTCFCTNLEDITDLSGQKASRQRKWDSCFTLDFAYIHGGSIRPAIYSRYRQWLTHKFASWQDQFQTIGCVGCGRCITWCPVGIDVTEEINEIRNNEQMNPSTISIKENH